MEQKLNSLAYKTLNITTKICSLIKSLINAKETANQLRLFIKNDKIQHKRNVINKKRQ